MVVNLIKTGNTSAAFCLLVEHIPEKERVDVFLDEIKVQLSEKEYNDLTDMVNATLGE